MTDSLSSRSMLFGLIVLLHGAIFWWILSPDGFTTPAPVAQSVIVAMLLSSAKQQAVPAPTLPREQTQQRVQQLAKPVPSNEPAVLPKAPAQPSEPLAEAATPPAVPAFPATILPPRFDAAYLNNPIPAYPPGARRLGLQGKVLLRVHVSTAGTATEVTLHKSSGSSALDQAAMVAVRKWRFVPAKQGAESTAAWVLVPIDFRLN